MEQTGCVPGKKRPDQLLEVEGDGPVSRPRACGPGHTESSGGREAALS